MNKFLSIRDLPWKRGPAGFLNKGGGSFFITFHSKIMLNLMRTIIVFLFLIFSSLGFQAFAQCKSGNTYPAITIPCGAPCMPLSFTVPDIRETSDYIAFAHPYTPFAF